MVRLMAEILHHFGWRLSHYLLVLNILCGAGFRPSTVWNKFGLYHYIISHVPYSIYSIYIKHEWSDHHGITILEKRECQWIWITISISRPRFLCGQFQSLFPPEITNAHKSDMQPSLGTMSWRMLLSNLRSHSLRGYTAVRLVCPLFGDKTLPMGFCHTYYRRSVADEPSLSDLAVSENQGFAHLFMMTFYGMNGFFFNLLIFLKQIIYIQNHQNGKYPSWELTSPYPYPRACLKPYQIALLIIAGLSTNPN